MKVIQIAGVLYLPVTPAKTLFHSTMVHEVVNRGDIFAVRCSDGMLTVIDGEIARGADWFAAAIMPTPFKQKVFKTVDDKAPKKDTITVAKMKKAIKESQELLANAQLKLNGL